MSSLNIPLPPTPAPGEGPATPAPPSPAPTPVLPDDSAFVTALMRRFVAGVKPRDISWKGARHANVFVGADAVDWLAENAVPGRDVSRSDATAIGELLRSRGLFAHHVYPEHAFMDEFHFYRYAPLADELAAEPQPLLEQPKPSAVDAWMQNMRRPSVAKIEKGQRIGNDDDVYTIVVLGASGDLAYKKTFPSLYGVWTQGFMPKNVKIFGYARSKIEHDDFISRVTSKIKVDKGCESVMEDFKSSLAYISGQYDQPESFQKLDAAIKEYEGQFASVAKKNRMFYLALPPSVFAEVSKHLKEQCYPTSGWARLVVEKPFGHDLASSNALSASLAQYWNESEIFRIDHYLGKDMSKNLLVLRFANRFFGGIWDRDSIENVQITFKETIGTEGRGGYFDEFGIIRDVIQNHLLQVLSLVAMEKPVTMHGEDIRNEKVKVLKYIPPVQLEDTLLGQYTASEDGKVEGYADDPTVPKGSNTPTFAVTVLFIKNERWDGVPFVLKAGKALNDKKVEIRVQFKEVAGNTLFPDIAQNELVIRIQPDEAIYIKMMNKAPGYNSAPKISELQLTYSRRYSDVRIPDAYETLMVDILRGDHGNFVRGDELEEAWRIFTPLLHRIDDAHPPRPGDEKAAKSAATPQILAPVPVFAGLVPGRAPQTVDVHRYAAGSRGPAGLDEFVGRYGFRTAPIPYEYKDEFK